MSRYKQSLLCIPYLILMFSGLCVSLTIHINDLKVFTIIYSIEIVFTLLQIITNYERLTKTSIIFILYTIYLLYYLSLTIVLISIYNVKLNQQNIYIAILNYILLIKWICLTLLFFCILGCYSGDKVLQLIIYTSKYSFSLSVFGQLIIQIRNYFIRRPIMIVNNDPINIVIDTVQNNEECCICLCINNGPWVRLDCNHLIHYDCIKLWLDKSNTCPLCRIKL
jgi:hypothetical protein